MTADCESMRLSLGAYALGSLEPADRSLVEAHLAGCDACAAEVDEFAAALPSLALLEAADVATPQLSAALFDRVVAAAEQPVVAPRRRHRLVAVAASVAVLAAGGIALGVGLETTSHHSTTRPVRLAAVATTEGPSTKLVLTVSGLPAHERCHLLAVAADGSEHEAGRWTATYDGAARVVEHTDVPRARLQRLVLLAADGRQLATTQL